MKKEILHIHYTKRSMKYTLEIITMGISDRWLNVDVIKTLSSLQSCSQCCTMTVLWPNLMALILALTQITQPPRSIAILCYFGVFNISLAAGQTSELTSILSNHHSITPSSPLPLSPSAHHCCSVSDSEPSLSRILFSLWLCCLPISADFSLFPFVHLCYPSLTSLFLSSKALTLSPHVCT